MTVELDAPAVLIRKIDQLTHTIDCIEIYVKLPEEISAQAQERLLSKEDIWYGFDDRIKASQQCICVEIRTHINYLREQIGSIKKIIEQCDANDTACILAANNLVDKLARQTRSLHIMEIASMDIISSVYDA